MSWRGKRKAGSSGHHGNTKPDVSNKPSVDESMNKDSPIFQIFQSCQAKLDEKHDKYERLVKMSRDITIESKRTIFGLHRITGLVIDSNSVLEEAENRLQDICNTKWKVIALELQHDDPYQYLRAYSPGLQEYIEAASLLHYLQCGQLICLEDIQKQLQFDLELAESAASAVEPVNQGNTDSAVPMTIRVKVSAHIPPTEYILGIADLTGELMRMAINSVGYGNVETPREYCSFMRIIYEALMANGGCLKELGKKLAVLKQSIIKVEKACYALQVRGSEVPQHFLKDLILQTTKDGEDDSMIDY